MGSVLSGVVLMLAILLTSFLYIALIAFGWFPCGCCAKCCPGVTVSDQLFFTTSSTCFCADGGLVTLNYDQNLDGWYGTILDICAALIQIKLECRNGSWSLVLTQAGLPGECLYLGTVVGLGMHSMTFESAVCDPFALVFSGRIADTGTGGCGCVGEVATFTIIP